MGESPLDPPRGKLEVSSIYKHFPFLKKSSKGSMCSKGWMHFPVGVENLQPLQFVTFVSLCLRAFVLKKCCTHFDIVCFNFLFVLFSLRLWGREAFHFVPQKPDFVPLQKISCHKTTIVCHELLFLKSLYYPCI